MQRATSPLNQLIINNTNSTQFFAIMNCSKFIYLAFMSTDLSQVILISSKIGYNTLDMGIILTVMSFFNLIMLFSGLIYHLRKKSLDKLKQEMIDEEEAQSDLKKLDYEDNHHNHHELH